MYCDAESAPKTRETRPVGAAQLAVEDTSTTGREFFFHAVRVFHLPSISENPADLLAGGRHAMLFAVVSSAMAFQPAARSTPVAPQSTSRQVTMQFRAPGSTDTVVADQRARAEASGQTPKEYEESTRRAANEYLASSGPHVRGSGDGPVQRAPFLKQLWDVDAIPAVPAEALSNEENVLATFYEIGGPLTNVLSTSVAKQLPMIPHVGIRVHGVEYFYSDHIECRRGQG